MIPLLQKRNETFFRAVRVGSKITWHIRKMFSLYGTFADSLCQVIFERSLNHIRVMTTQKESTLTKKISKRMILQNGMFGLFRMATLVNCIVLFAVVGYIILNGWEAINWSFLTQPPTDSMTKGGIFPCIVGTFCLSIGAIAVAFPIGVATAIFLNEYAHQGVVLKIIRLGISNLAGVPSVVFGLFGMSVFVVWLEMGVSILSGALTLGIMTLPVIIGAAEEALRTVPDTYREASLALGGTKFQTIVQVVLPAAMQGILTGCILGISRAAGETAPIMYTAAVFYSPQMPSSLFDEVMALPYHIYVLATAGTEIEATRHLQYGSALVLIILVLGMNMTAMWLRYKLRKNTE